jgi:hypothetical protein
MSFVFRPKAAAIARTFSPTGFVRSMCPGELAHVHVGQVGKAPRLADGDHRHRAVVPARDDGSPLQWVDREVNGVAAAADGLADGERLGAVLAADDNRSRDGERVETVAHRVRRGLVGARNIPAAEPARTRERRCFRDRGERVAAAAHRRGPGAVSGTGGRVRRLRGHGG